MINIKKLWFKFAENRQKIKQKHWYLLHWIHSNLKNWQLWKKNIVQNPLYLIVNTADDDIEEKNGSKYLTFASADKNKEVFSKFKKCTELLDEIKYLIKTINGGKSGEYGKDFMKTKSSPDDHLPLNKPLKFHAITIIIKSVFEENKKYYPQLFLDECLYQL